MTCSRCEYSTYLEIPALGHDKIAHAEQLSSCTEDGWYAYETCSRCDYSTYLEMPSLGGHAFGSWIEKVAPTPTAPGEEERKCGRCEHFETREVTYLEYFERAVEKASSASTLEASYGAIYSALTVYAELSSEDKAAASDAYQTLLAAIDTYNARATAANEELKTASEVAFMPMSTYFGFLAALWFLLKRKLM